MNFISVCSGIDAASQAWLPLGWKALAFSEIEPFPCAVLAHHYPDVPNLGDLTRWREWPMELLTQADVLIGGTPCQSFSVAGNRESMDNARGLLSLCFWELADAIDNLRSAAGLDACTVLWENVPGALNTPDNAFGSILGAACGHRAALDAPRGGSWPDAGVAAGPRRTAAWRILDAQYQGLAQRRRRIFLLARGGAGNWASADALLPLREGGSGDPPTRRTPGQDAAVCPTLRAGGNSTGGDRPPGTDVLQYGDRTGPLDTDGHSVGVLVEAEGFYTTAGRDFQTTPDLAMPLKLGGTNGGHSNGVRTGMAVRRLLPVECEKLQGFSPGYTALPGHSADGPRYRALGNSMAVPCISWLGRQIERMRQPAGGDGGNL